MFRNAVPMLALFLLMASPGWADVVVLSNGSRIEGTIQDQNDSSVTIRTTNGVIVYPMRLVRSITRPVQPNPEPAQGQEPQVVAAVRVEPAPAAVMSVEPPLGNPEGPVSPKGDSGYPWDVSSSAIRLSFTIMEPVRTPGLNSPDDLAKRLNGFGNSMARAMFVIWRGDADVCSEESDPSIRESNRTLARDPNVRNLIVRTLALRATSDGVRGLNELLDPSTPVELRVSYLTLLASLNEPAVVSLALQHLGQIAGSSDAIESVDRAAIQDIVSTLLRNHSESYAWLSAHRSELETTALRVFGPGVAAVDSPRAWRELETWIGRSRELDAMLVQWMATMESVRRHWVRDPGLELIDQALESREDATRLGAVNLLGRLDEVDRVAAIALRLVDRSLEIREAASRVLVKLSGTGDGFDPAGWEARMQAEQAWIAETFPGIQQDLLDRSPEPALAALAELTNHRLMRETVRDALASTLAHPEAGVRAEACRTAIRLGYPDLAGWLVVALGDEDPVVSEVAWRGLQEITGEQRPRVASAWLDLVK